MIIVASKKQKDSLPCGISQDILVDYVERECAPSLAQDLLRHIHGCRHCLPVVNSLEGQKAALKETVIRSTNLDETMKRIESNVMAAIEDVIVEEPLVQVRRRTLWAASAAAVIVFVVGALFFGPGGQQRWFTTGQQQAVANVDGGTRMMIEAVNGDPAEFGEVILSHQDPNELVFEAVSGMMGTLNEEQLASLMNDL